MKLEDKVPLVVERLGENDIEATVTVASKGLFGRRKAIQLLAQNVDDDILFGGEIESILRSVVGYGNFDKRYDHSTKVFVATYSPLAKERSSTFGSSDSYFRPRPVYRTGGSTEK